MIYIMKNENEKKKIMGQRMTIGAKRNHFD